MNKTKRQLRAEAVERLRKGESNNIEWLILGDDCPSWVNYDTLSYNKTVRERIADLLEDKTTEMTVYNEASNDELFRCSYCHCEVYNIDMTEGDCGWGFTFCPQCGGEVHESDSRKIEAELGGPTNEIDGETNGIHADAPLVDEPPESDAIAHARWRWKYRHEDGDEVVMSEYNCNLLMSDLDAIADMVERDYVSREVYEDLREEFTWETTFLHRMGKKCGTKDVPSLVAYVDKLEARVEELEAIDRRIAETDSRWEAAISDLERMTAERDELQKQLDAVSAPSGNLDAQARAEIEDAERSRAVSGDAAAEVDAGTDGTEKTPQEPRECGRITFTDTREMLEADVRQYANPEGNTGTLGACWERKMIGFLDRQAAITRAECDKPNWDYCETCEQLKAMQNEIAELKADNDCLRDRNEKLDYEVRAWKGEAKTQRNNFEQATEARKQWQRKYENLKATSYSAEAPSDESELARELGKALAERDMYREKLGRAVDAAHEVVRMMEVE